MSRRWRIALGLCLISSLISGLGVFILVSVLDGQEHNATRIERTRDDVVVAKAKVDGPDSTLSRAVKRLDRTVRVLKSTTRRLRIESAQQDALIRDLRAAGAKLPSVVRGVAGPPGLPGVTGRAGASATPLQIRAAVARYCEDNRCGVPPTQEQVNAAIKACSVAGGCRGPQGAAGRDGTNGRDGKDGVSPPPQPMLPCSQADPALGYQCAPNPDTPPSPPPKLLP